MPHNYTTPALLQKWRQHIEEWRNSGLSQQAFCRDRNLSYHQFHYWRKKLALATVDETPLRSSALVPVTYTSPSPDTGLSVHLPIGISLRGIAPDNLAIVERLLVSLS
jgi:hypothetical protein